MGTRRGRSGLLLAGLLSALFLSCWAFAQEAGDPRDPLRGLEAARLSAEERALLRERALEAARVGIPEGEVAAIIQRGVGRGVRAPEIARLLDVVAEVRRQDLPAGPVLDKVKEGLAKGAPPDRIAGVASRVAGNLATSRELVRRAEREGVRGEAAGDRSRAVEAVADALGRGVSRQELEHLSREVAGGPRREATLSRLEAGAQATADLVSMGLPPGDARETVGLALSRGLSRHDLERLRERLAGERRQGGSLEEAGRRIRDELRSGRGGGFRGRDRERDRAGGRGREGSGGREDRSGSSSGPH